MKSKNIILVVIVVILITLSIFTITILKNKFSNYTFKNTTMRDREYSNIVYDINGNPIDNL